ncbi:hypothetical protein BDV96DRAFT_599479 [Lophiotrema nucula]|uniref:Uncharacterized protein n=1 Tax=Lophiotrema nucula TaxID=690887 RepID=A0A6A5Z8S6_9PLEO|nr:hypothetical protein BDV96DRAFT_599479 [Lophiotrema nucula]
MPGTLDHAAQLCSNATRGQIQDCLSAALGTTANTRTVNEVWLRSFGIHVVTLASYGHLLSLQGFTSPPSGWTYLAPIFFLTYPEIALAQVLIRTTTSIGRMLRLKQRVPLRYFVACCLGVRAGCSASETSAIGKSSYPLVDLDPKEVICLPHKYNLLWLGRIGLLLALLAQYLGSLVLWIRLVFFLKDKSYWHWHIDYRNFQVVLGGLTATLNSMGILLTGCEWEIVPGRVRGSVEEVEGPKEINTGITRTDSGIELLSSAEKECPEVQGSRSPDIALLAFLSRLKGLNHSLYAILNRHFPSKLQLDFEVAVVIHRILAYGVVVWTWNRFPGGCPPIFRILSEATVTHDYRKLCPDRTNTYDPLTFTLIPQLRESLRVGPWLMVPAILFSIALARILLRWLAKRILLLCVWANGEQPRWLVQAEYWLLSGRTILSFPMILLIFSLAPFWFDGLLEQRSWHRETEVNLKNGAMDPVDRMAVNILMWKDPWQDNLYII